MNQVKYFFLLAAFAFGFQNVQAQKKAKKKIVETEFMVSGICGMCEERIENALSVKGVKSAEWDLETKLVKVIFDESKITEARLHELVNEVGHDTEETKATDDEYATVHGCCKYRTLKDCE